ncbi:6333_t:CDS:1, partial [Ambispora gerdemannii]
LKKISQSHECPPMKSVYILQFKSRESVGAELLDIISGSGLRRFITIA